MSPKLSDAQSTPITRYYRGADVPMRAIREFARQVAELFNPDKLCFQCQQTTEKYLKGLLEELGV